MLDIDMINHLREHRGLDIGEDFIYADLPFSDTASTLFGKPLVCEQIEIVCHPDFASFKPVLMAALSHSRVLGQRLARPCQGWAFRHRNILLCIGRPISDDHQQDLWTTELKYESINPDSYIAYLAVGTKDNQIEGFYHEACHLADLLWFKTDEQAKAEVQYWNGNLDTACFTKQQAMPFFHGDISFGAWREWYSEYSLCPPERWVSEVFQHGMFEGKISLEQAQFVSHDLLGNYAVALNGLSKVPDLPPELANQLTKRRMLAGLREIWLSQGHPLILRYMRQDLNRRGLIGVRL